MSVGTGEHPFGKDHCSSHMVIDPTNHDCCFVVATTVCSQNTQIAHRFNNYGDSWSKLIFFCLYGSLALIFLRGFRVSFDATEMFYQQFSSWKLPVFFLFSQRVKAQLATSTKFHLINSARCSTQEAEKKPKIRVWITLFPPHCFFNINFNMDFWGTECSTRGSTLLVLSACLEQYQGQEFGL